MNIDMVCVCVCVKDRKCQRIFPALIRAREHKCAASIFMGRVRTYIHTHKHIYTSVEAGVRDEK